MDKREELRRKILNAQPAIIVWEAVVVSVEGDTCTVRIWASDLEVSDVRLIAEIGGTPGLLITPKVGSFVLVACVQNEVADLFIAQYTEIDALKFAKNNVEISADANTVTVKNSESEVTIESNSVLLKQNQTQVKLSGGKVEIKNAGTSLSTLFSDLISLLNSFSVITSTGPSAGLNPATIALLTQLQVKVNQLLQ